MDAALRKARERTASGRPIPVAEGVRLLLAVGLAILDRLDPAPAAEVEAIKPAPRPKRTRKRKPAEEAA